MRNQGRARRLTGIATALLAIAVAGPAVGSGRPTADPDAAGATSDGVDTGSVLVQLSKEPLATSTAVERSENKRVDFGNSRTRNVRADLAKQRNELRQWLKRNAPRAKVTSEYDVALNAVGIRLNGTPITVLQGGPGVVDVEYQTIYTPTTADLDPDLALINALAGWEAAGADYGAATSAPSTWAGHGIKVGVVDSGIDASHPCFDDAEYPNVPQFGDKRFTNNKVIVARVFNNKVTQGRYTPEAFEAHGTHVAGTIACNLDTAALVDGASIEYAPSGVAPGAQLGNYNVFPGGDAGARSEDILNALQAAAEDGMDVINMSLGSGSNGKQDLLTTAVDNLDRGANIVVTVSAGNEGPDHWTIDSPGMAERSLTAGASSVGHYVGVPVTADGFVSVGAIGDFPVPDADLGADLGVVRNGDALGTACTENGGVVPVLTGEIALLSRGGCTFGEKIQNVEKAGAIAAIVVNDAEGDPSAMGTDPLSPTTIPAVMVPLADTGALMALDGDAVTIGAGRAYARTSNDDILMSFSSWGPTDVEIRVKPDVVAPGGNVLSPVLGGAWDFFSGTSMASPHLAGMAAAVIQAHPDWDAWQVRSAIVNTADRNGVVSLAPDGSRTSITDVLKVGSGLAQLDNAVNATLLLSQPSISFGSVPSGSGRSITKPVDVTNVSDEDIAFTPVVTAELVTEGTPLDPPLFSVADETIELAPGEATTLAVTFEAKKFTGWAFAQAHLELGEHAHAALFAHVK